jgi:hypothetical protein
VAKFVVGFFVGRHTTGQMHGLFLLQWCQQQPMMCCCVGPQIRRQEAIDGGKTQRRVYVEKPDMRSKKLARKVIDWHFTYCMQHTPCHTITGPACCAALCMGAVLPHPRHTTPTIEAPATVCRLGRW